MATATKALRILVVEDESLIAMLIESMVEDLGHTVGAAAARLDEAVRLAGTERFDLALVDVNLNGEMSYPVADVLGSRGIPFVFATGYGASGLDPRYRHVPALAKPFSRADLEKIILRLSAGPGCAAPDRP